jgi:hypothetical protein
MRLRPAAAMLAGRREDAAWRKGEWSEMSSTESPRGSSYDLEDKGAGWIVFAAIMLGLAGIIGMIDGIVAISKSSFYVADARYVFSGPTTWGWVMLIVGAVTVFAAFRIFRGAQWARWFGIVIAGLQAIAQLLTIQVYPFWSLCVFALDILVIYGLATYGTRRLDV